LPNGQTEQECRFRESGKKNLERENQIVVRRRHIGSTCGNASSRLPPRKHLRSTPLRQRDVTQAQSNSECVGRVATTILETNKKHPNHIHHQKQQHQHCGAVSAEERAPRVQHPPPARLAGRSRALGRREERTGRVGHHLSQRYFVQAKHTFNILTTASIVHVTKLTPPGSANPNQSDTRECHQPTLRTGAERPARDAGRGLGFLFPFQLQGARHRRHL
jgi:hypothetical protein